MGFFNLLFGSRSANSPNGEQLQEMLFRAVADGNHARLADLCRVHREAIIRQFPDWRTIPPDKRSNRTHIEHHIKSVLAVAQVFAKHLDEPTLLQQLAGEGQSKSNPIVKWQDGLRQALDLMEQLKHAEAEGLLGNIIAQLSEVQGSAVDEYLPLAHGYLGQCYFETGNSSDAISEYGRALELCEGAESADGVAAHLSNLYEVHRYRGDTAQAASYATRLAEVLHRMGRSEEAARYRKQASLVVQGEPLNRVVAQVGNRCYELDDVPMPAGETVQLGFERNRITLRPAELLRKFGEYLGSNSRHAEALAAFDKAIDADRFDPHSRYLKGFTLMHLRRYADAVYVYHATEALAPGWYQCRSDLWLAEQMDAGAIGHEVFRALNVLADGPQPASEKVCVAEQLLTDVPDLACVHLLYGQNLAGLGRDQEAREAYREGLRCEPEPDVKTRLLVALGLSTQDRQERGDLLQQAQSLRGNLISAATAMLAMRTKG